MSVLEERYPLVYRLVLDLWDRLHGVDEDTKKLICSAYLLGLHDATVARRRARFEQWGDR